MTTGRRHSCKAQDISRKGAMIIRIGHPPTATIWRRAHVRIARVAATPTLIATGLPLMLAIGVLYTASMPAAAPAADVPRWTYSSTVTVQRISELLDCSLGHWAPFSRSAPGHPQSLLPAWPSLPCRRGSLR